MTKAHLSQADVLLEELLALICGKKLGEGHSREVYVCNFNPKYVVKFEKRSGEFNNVREWEAWDQWGHVKGVGEWLAPCVEISPCGKILIQKRTTPTKEFPEKVPGFLTDLFQFNFGMYDGRFVCHDYGFGLATSNLNTTLKKARWIEESTVFPVSPSKEEFWTPVKRRKRKKK